MTTHSPLSRRSADPARAAIARALAAHYSELADADGPEPERFSLARAMQEAATDRGLRDGYERELCGATATMAGESFDAHRLWIPLQALRRDMTVAGVSGSNYLAGTASADPVDVLRPWSVVLSAGVQALPGLVEHLTVPRVATKSTAGWLSSEGVTQTPDAQPVLGQTAMTPKSGAAHVAMSRQFRVQAQQSEPLVRAQLLRAVGELLDVAFFAGTGADGEPLGLLSTAGIGTQSGSTLAHAGLLAMRASVLNAGAIESRLQWVGHPGVQQVLGARERASGNGGFLWAGGQVLDGPAYATRNAPTATLVCGDFSTAILGLWGPAAIKVEVDPFSSFNTGAIRARVIVLADFGFPQPAAFNVATAVD